MYIFDLICSSFPTVKAPANVLLWNCHVEENLGRASFGSWELGPPSASEMAPDLEMLPAPQYIYPALQYLHKTAQYMRSGVHTIFAHAPICVLTIICSAGRAQDLAGGDSGAETDLGRSSSSVLLLLLLHPCPSAGYRSPPCTWHPPPAVSRPYHSFWKHCKVSRILPSILTGKL